MKKYNIALLLAALALSTFFFACEKEEPGLPEIDLGQPVEGQLYIGPVSIVGWVRDESLHRLKISITKDTDTSLLFNYSRHWHGRSEFYFEELYTPDSLSVETPVTLTIEVEDEDDLKSSKTIKFRVKS